MADTTNLSQFLSDVADAIRTKKETTGQIPAENFDTEIASINTLKSEEVIINPTTSVQVVEPSEGKNAITKATVEAVTSDIDSNIVAENIKSGITILGVDGSFEGGTSEDLQEQLDNQDLIIQQLQEELSDKAIYDCNYYNARLVPTNGKIISYITEISAQLDTSSVTNMANMFSGCTNLTTIPQLNTSSVTNMGGMFQYCTNLTEIPLLDTSNVTNMQYMLNNCTSLTTIPLLDTSNVINMYHMFDGCTNLTTIPLLDTSSLNDMQYMFYNCANLSDESLNNILAMCTNAASYTSTKTLRYIGLTSTQANKCKTLSNYSAFTSAGWTT